MGHLTGCNACSIGRRGMRRPRATAYQEFVIERFGDPEGIGVLDETGIPKQGIRSVGVQKH